MSGLEDMLALELRANGINFIREYQFHPKRKYRADFAMPEHRIIVECQGAIYVPQTGHTSGKGIQRDYHKSNCAQLMGYTYLQYSRRDIEDGTAIREICEVIGRCEK